MINIVKDVKKLNNFVDRITFDDNAIIDIYSPSLKCNIGESIQINLAASQPNKMSEYIMHGHVYMKKENFMSISSGGLLAVLPANPKFNISSDVYLHLTKSKRRSSSKKESEAKKIRN